MPETLRLLIENWVKGHGCSCYKLQSGYLTKTDLQKADWNFKQAVIFVYDFSANGIITDTSKLNNGLLTVESNNNFVQYGKIVDVFDNGTIQRVNSNFCYKIENGVRFTLEEGAGAMFQKIYTASLKYVAIQPDCNCN